VLKNAPFGNFGDAWTTRNVVLISAALSGSTGLACGCASTNAGAAAVLVSP
jgi:hypothetical protein